MYPQGVVFMDGEFLAPSEAKMSIFDLGFVWGDSVYDVTSTWKGQFFMLEQHLDRFEASCEKMRLDNPYGRDDVRRACAECVQRAGLEDAYVKLQLHRGLSAGVGQDPRAASCHFVTYAVPYVWIWGEARCRTGADLHLSHVERVSSKAIDQRAKNYNRADLVQARHDAYAAGCDDAILCGPDGYVTEGSGYNVFIVNEGTVATPDLNILEGITRQAVRELCELEGVPLEVRPVHPDELQNAQEVFASSTAGGVMPVVALDGRPIGNGHSGIVTSKLRDAYWSRREQDWHGTSIREILEAAPA